MIINNKYNTAIFELKQQTFYPVISTNLSLINPWLKLGKKPSFSELIYQKYRQISQVASKRFGSHRFLQLASVLLLTLPTKSLTNFEPINTFDKVIMTDTLTIATTDSFVHGEHIHGYGFDVASRYAEHLGVDLDVQHFDNAVDAMLAVQLGQADMLVSSNGDARLNNLTVNCGDNGAVSANFGFSGQGQLFLNAKDYLCSDSTQQQNKQMAKFYQTDLLRGYNQMHFDKIMAERLPKYLARFQSAAATYNHDWRLLTAIAYQESHLNPSATSPTGVQGIMMLTQDTAKAMGISDRTNASQSIQGGAKYLAKLNADFAHIPESERLWFVLAGYNMGPNAVLRIQEILEQSGKNPNSWSNFYSYLTHNKHKNSRYVQCLHYVTNIRAFFEEIRAQHPLPSDEHSPLIAKAL